MAVGDLRLALALSSAAECFIAAADTFDDLQDQDDEGALWSTAGVATASNVATFLLFLSQLAIGRLTQSGASEARVLGITGVFAAAGARACGGQQRDLDQRNPWEVDEAWYLETIGAKSASLVECLCRSGGIVADADPAEVETFARFGFNLGVALQIGNDVVAASQEDSKRNDLRLGKPTLPLLFALQSGPQFIRDELSAIIHPGHGTA